MQHPVEQKHSKPLARIGVLFAIAALSACGGGGGGDSAVQTAAQPPASAPPAASPAASSPAVQSTTSIASSQANAQTLVATANANVATVAEANTVSSVPGAVNLGTLPIGATTTTSLNCSSIGTGGSGTISATINTDSAGHLGTAHYVYNQCTYSAVGETVTFNGTVDYTYAYSGSSISTLSYVYDLTYSYSGVYTASGRITSSRTCTYSGVNVNCAYNIGSATVSGFSVTSSGTVTTIASGTVRTNGSASTNNLTIVYDHWVYDSATGRATSGTVTMTDSSGNTATITASASGYAVRIVYNGVTSQFTVTFS